MHTYTILGPLFSYLHVPIILFFPPAEEMYFWRNPRLAHLRKFALHLDPPSSPSKNVFLQRGLAQFVHHSTRRLPATRRSGAVSSMDRPDFDQLGKRSWCRAVLSNGQIQRVGTTIFRNERNAFAG